MCKMEGMKFSLCFGGFRVACLKLLCEVVTLLNDDVARY